MILLKISMDLSAGPGPALKSEEFSKVSYSNPFIHSKRGWSLRGASCILSEPDPSSVYESNSARSAWTGAAVVRPPSREY